MHCRQHKLQHKSKHAYKSLPVSTIAAVVQENLIRNTRLAIMIELRNTWKFKLLVIKLHLEKILHANLTHIIHNVPIVYQESRIPKCVYKIVMMT